MTQAGPEGACQRELTGCLESIAPQFFPRVAMNRFETRERELHCSAWKLSEKDLINRECLQRRMAELVRRGNASYWSALLTMNTILIAVFSSAVIHTLPTLHISPVVYGLDRFSFCFSGGVGCCVHQSYSIAGREVIKTVRKMRRVTRSVFGETSRPDVAVPLRRSDIRPHSPSSLRPIRQT